MEEESQKHKRLNGVSSETSFSGTGMDGIGKGGYKNSDSDPRYPTNDNDEERNEYVRHICNGKIIGSGIEDEAYHIQMIGGGSVKKHIMLTNRAAKCHLVHNHNPYALLGPFHLEVKTYAPFRTIVHNFFTDAEMEWMVEYSKPLLSANRHVPESNKLQSKSDRRYASKEKGYTVSKTIQTWFNDISYNDTGFLDSIRIVRDEKESARYEFDPITDETSFSIDRPIMLGISKRIELVTNFNLTKPHAASLYQTTNYGLGGLVEAHMDPWGFEEGIELVDDRMALVATGDYIATFMGWLEGTSGGGGTSFQYPEYEGLLKPTKGSAAFWINLTSDHTRDGRASHGGCPVLKGSKWILNKWINSFDQWKGSPCSIYRYQPIKPFFAGMTLV